VFIGINSDLTSQTSLQIIVGLIRGKGSRGILQKKNTSLVAASEKYSLFNAKFLISPNNSDLTDFYLKRGPERPLEKNER